MNTLFSFFPGLPWDNMVIVINMVAIAGATLHIYGVFLEKEKRRDMVFVIGGICLFIYSLWIRNKIFALAMGGFTISCLIEFIEISTGHHTHTDQMTTEYKNPNQ